MRARAALLLGAGLVALAATAAGQARAADECNGLPVCLPVSGPWVVVPVAGGVDWELACPLRGYVVGGTDARVAARDVDVSFRAETGSPVGPGVTTRRSVVFHAARTARGAGTTSFRPFVGCIPSSGGGGRALTGRDAVSPGYVPAGRLLSVVVTVSVKRGSQTVRAACPSPALLVGSTHAVGFARTAPPAAAQRAAVRVRRTVVDGVVVARVSATPAAGGQARVQVRAVCARPR